MPNPNAKRMPPNYAIPSSLGELRRRKRVAPDAQSTKAGELQRRLGALEEEVRACRLLSIDIEDVAATARAFVEAVETDHGAQADTEWTRERVSGWAVQFRDALNRMINQTKDGE